jgi:putative acetyltransferase
MVSIDWAESDEDIEAVRQLFLEYADSVGVSLCFQGFDREVAELPGAYARPKGGLLLASESGRSAGCVAYRRLSAKVAEMKRLFVRPEFHGRGFGRLLAERVILEAKADGYQLLRLDTLPTMVRAQALYDALGFRPIPAYYENPIPGTAYLELDLR